MSDPSPYQVNITMLQDTADTLCAQNYQLYAFKVVNGPSNGLPVVWFSTSTFGLSTAITWSESYRVFTSRSATVGPNTKVLVDNDYDAALGDLLTVNSPTGTGVVTDGGPAGAISATNITSTAFSCGISQLQSDGTYAPLALFPLYGNMEDEMVPVEKVFLMFASATVDTGTVIEKSFGSGIMIDLTGAATRSVSFDLNNGWSDSHGTWGTLYPPNTSLVQLLINGEVPAGV